MNSYAVPACHNSSQNKYRLPKMVCHLTLFAETDKTNIYIQVVLAASICTRGGKAVLSRQFRYYLCPSAPALANLLIKQYSREMQRSRIEGLLASFPKLADTGTQHTTVEQDNVRFVYQPLDELYMVLITNRQSNILQDIDSLHLFSQVVTSTCKTLDEREILKNAYELLSAFDELVTLGYRENLTLSQIKTFLEMESHEERIQEIISRVCSASVKYVNTLTYSRTKNWRLPKNESAKRNNSKCRGKSRPGVVERQFHERQYILHILHLHVQPLRIHMIPMRLRSRSHSSTFSTFRCSHAYH